MSEFVECQNCGRKFFGENIDCPYCRDEQEVDDRLRAAHGGATFGLHGVLFAGFMLVLMGLVLVALGSLVRADSLAARIQLGLEAAGALVTLVGLARRKRWGRVAAIAFIAANAALGILAVVLRGQGAWLAWGPGPAAMLLFLVPFFSPQARERYSR